MKKALIVGVSQYAPLLRDLESSSAEGERWSQLLIDVYGFAERNVCLLVDRRATKQAVLERLIWLFGDTRPGDQLLFIFLGHGVRVGRSESTGDALDLRDEALVMHPAGASDVLDVAILDDDLTTLYCSMAVDSRALPTFIFDCCHSGGFDFPEPERRRKQAIVAADPGDRSRSTGNVVRFLQRLGRRVDVAQPVILAASGESDQAAEIGRNHERRSLFSSLAIAALRENPALSYQSLLESIEPSMRFIAQTPRHLGDSVRIQRPFLS